MPKFTVTFDEARQMIRERYNLPHSVDVEFEATNLTTTIGVDNEWRDVPHTWDQVRPPMEVEQLGRVDIMFCEGDTYLNVDPDDYYWDQRGLGADIVKFRKSTKNRP